MEIGYINGMKLGVGFNTATLDVQPAPALDNVVTTRPVVNAGGQEVYFRVELVSSTLSLAKRYDLTHPFTLGTPVGSRNDTIHFDFPSGKLSNPPKVHVMLNMIDSDRNTNTRIAVSPVNVTVNGFDVRIKTWFNTKVFAVGVAWFAYAQ